MCGKSRKITKQKVQGKEEDEDTWSIHKRAASIWKGSIAICTVAPLGTGSPSQAQWSGGREGGEDEVGWRRKASGGARFDRPTRQDGCVWGGRRADAAGWKALLGLQADSAGWLSASRPDFRLELRGLVWQHWYKTASPVPANFTSFVKYF